ncbi:M48 family metalloprotease [Pedobacter sp. AW1-32]|uniref:M48 family metalloprotease n=1 Tax=Pedobacter sp. AW1-32 TaxID=3383026 RepID=UPI003FEDC747
MQTDALQPSTEFRKMAKQAVWSIVLFIATYFVLILLAIALTVLAAMGGVLIIAIKPMFITFALGLGLMSFGVLILIFLVKFIFRRVVIDRSHLTEIKPGEQPELFKMISGIVKEVGTDFPKRVYFSSEVNASVFYDSSFWSMFFPVRKNLQIGLGLMNSVSIDELKAILAHEFGHFSQKSMRVGAYVYNVNRIIYNVLNENDGFGNAINKWASMSNFIALFVMLAAKVIEGIQYILRKVYTRVNLSHMALSREMEFHADTVAAHVAGSAPLINSLLRLQLADYSMNRIYSFYDAKIRCNEKTNNIFPQHYFLICLFAKDQKLDFKDNLPLILQDTHKKFNKSKLVLKDQWASHPSTADRIVHLQNLNLPLRNYGSGISTTLLNNKEVVMEQITAKLFETVTFSDTPIVTDEQAFEAEFLKERKENSLPDVFNGFFDFRNPYVQKETIAQENEHTSIKVSKVFGDQTLDLIYEREALLSDLAIIQDVASGNLDIKSFDYDGVRYSKFDAAAFIVYLKEEIKKIEITLDDLDKQIYYAFKQLATEQNLLETFNEKYVKYNKIALVFLEQEAIYNKMVQTSAFVHTSMTFELIEQNMFMLKKEEKNFKAAIQDLLVHPLYNLEQKSRTDFEHYLETDKAYFGGKIYFNLQVEELMKAINTFGQIIFQTQFAVRKELLVFESALIDAVPMNVEGQ